MNGGMTETTHNANEWWGTFELEVGETGYWRAGPLELWATRTQFEWRVRFRRDDEPAESVSSAEVPTPLEPPEDAGAELRRYAFKQTTPAVKILPFPADRAFVIKPDAAFVVPPREEARLYISTPVWMNVYLGGSSAPMLSVPTHRPSDTWFGANTREGEVCYASRTHARRKLEHITRLSHRAISVVRIRNQAPTKLEFERIKIPVPNLSIFADGDGYLWTESVMLEREEDGDFAGLRLGKGAPDEAGSAREGDRASEVRRVGGPREQHAKGLSLRTFGHLLG